MKCPKCGYPRLRYVVKRNFRSKDQPPREDFRVKCPKCGFEGEYKTEIDELVSRERGDKEE